MQTLPSLLQSQLSSQLKSGIVMSPPSSPAGAPLRSSSPLSNFNFSMDPIIGGALISAGSGIISGLFGNKSSKRALQDRGSTKHQARVCYSAATSCKGEIWLAENQKCKDFRCKAVFNQIAARGW